MKDDTETREVIEARELTDVDVQRISLVEHSASRIPIRFFKSNKGESPMINLSAIGIKKRAILPSVLAVTLSDKVPEDQAQQILKSAGYESTLVSKGDNVKTYFMDSKESVTKSIQEDKYTTIQLGAAQVICKSIDLSEVFAMLGTQSLSDEVNFLVLPEIIYQATVTLRERIMTAIVEVPRSELAGEIEKLTTEFKNLVLATEKLLPVSIAKADKELSNLVEQHGGTLFKSVSENVSPCQVNNTAEALTKNEGNNDNTTGENTDENASESNTEQGDNTEGKEPNKEEVSTEENSDENSDETSDDDKDKDDTKETDNANGMAEEVTKALATLTEVSKNTATALSELKDLVEKGAKDTEALNAKVDALENKTDKVSKSVKGTIVGAMALDDDGGSSESTPAVHSKAKKSGLLGNFDTGMRSGLNVEL